MALCGSGGFEVLKIDTVTILAPVRLHLCFMLPLFYLAMSDRNLPSMTVAKSLLHKHKKPVLYQKMK